MKELKQLTIDGKSETLFDDGLTKYHQQGSLFNMAARKEQIDPLGTGKLFDKEGDHENTL